MSPTHKAIEITTTFSVKKDANKYYLVFTLTQGTTAINLSGSTIQLKVSDWNTPLTIKFTGNLIITNAVAGICQYLVQATDFNTEGRYMGQLFITYTATGKYIKTEVMEIYVQGGVGNV